MKNFRLAFNKIIPYLDFLVVFILVEFNIKKFIRIKKAKEPILLRGHTSDIKAFRQIFVRQEYRIDNYVPSDFDPKVIIDGGGNIGLASVYFKNKYKNAKIISIEPNQDNFEILQQNIKNYTDVIGVKSAIWDKSTYLKIKNNGSEKWSFVVHEATESEENSFLAVSILDIMKKYELDKIDILKLDVESAEKEIFSASNCDEWLEKTHILIIELHDYIREGTAKAVFNAVQKYNYSFSNIGENLIFIFDHEKSF